MRTSIIPFLGLCALAIASPDQVQVRQANPSLSSILSQISSLSAQLDIPTSIAAQLTGVPTSIAAALANASAFASLQSQILTAPPPWFTSLTPAAQSYFVALAPKYTSIIPQIISLEVAAGLITVVGTGTSASAARVTSTGFTNSTTSSSMLSKTSSDSTSTTVSVVASSTKAASSSSSTGGAAPTGGLTAGVVGAFGFLGLVLAL